METVFLTSRLVEQRAVRIAKTSDLALVVPLYDKHSVRLDNKQGRFSPLL
jgi:hypothetical protein